MSSFSHIFHIIFTIPLSTLLFSLYIFSLYLIQVVIFVVISFLFSFLCVWRASFAAIQLHRRKKKKRSCLYVHYYITIKVHITYIGLMVLLLSFLVLLVFSIYTTAVKGTLSLSFWVLLSGATLHIRDAVSTRPRRGVWFLFYMRLCPL